MNEETKLVLNWIAEDDELHLTGQAYNSGGSDDCVAFGGAIRDKVNESVAFDTFGDSAIVTSLLAAAIARVDFPAVAKAFLTKLEEV